MLIIGLMVIALICLAVGLVLPSSAWLIASLIATAGAGYLVWKMRSAIAPAGAGTGSASRARVASAEDDADAADSGTATTETADRHTADSHTVDSHTADSETTVISAVQPDGPNTDARTDATQVIPAIPAAEAGDVWVIDGRPRYHLGSCPIIQGQDAEPIPFDQAVEDGFMPCSLCEPHMARTSR